MSLERILKIASFSLPTYLVVFPGLSSAQDKPFAYISQPDPEARLAVLGVNAGVNGLICGITAAMENRNILHDSAVCVLGGIIQFTGMELGMTNIPVLPGAALRITEIGTSVIDNTLNGNEPLDYLSHSFGPVTIRIETKGGELDFYWNILPILGLSFNLMQLNEPDFLNSLNYQAFVFRTKYGPPNSGFTFGNVFTYQTESSSFTLAHEFNHVLQYIRLRPAQKFIGFEELEEEHNLRIGEDLAVLFLNTPLAICAVAGGEACGRRYWNILEIESYAMETANEEHPLNFSQ